jgi:FkbM family methyltransferase
MASLKTLKGHIKTIFKNLGYYITPNDCLHNPYLQLATGLNNHQILKTLDIGANIGQFAQGLLNNGYQGTIVSFEPLLDTHNQLIESRKKHRNNNWIIGPRIGLSSHSDKLNINVCTRSSCSSLLQMLQAHTEAMPNAKISHQETIQVLALDSVFKDYIKNNEKFFIKIDTQGYEWEVLMGAKECLKLASAIMCEVSLCPLFKGQKPWREILDYLEAQGFYLWATQKAFVNPQSGQDLQLNLIFLKKEI